KLCKQNHLLHLMNENDTEINKFNNYKSNVENTEQKGDWKTVSYRTKLRLISENKKPKILCNGSKTTGKKSTIQGAKKRFWLYVGKIQGKDTKEDDIKSWISDMEGTDEIIVKKLTTIGHLALGCHLKVHLKKSLTSPFGQRAFY
ncbi:hypothetical protein HHI36_021885, partial [Cryptolaemus montrouzieri]